MKLIRTAVAVATVGSLVLGATAEAKVKPKPVCNFITDAAGDAALIGSPAPDPNVETLDVLSADIASDTKNVTAVIRVKKLAKTSTSAPSGMRWQFGFTAEEVLFSLAAHASPTGTILFDGAHRLASDKSGSLYGGGVTGSFDLVKNEIHITAPVSLFAGEASIKPGKTTLSDLKVNTYIDIVVPDAANKFGGGAILSYGVGDDVATSTKTYKAGTLSCVLPGK